MKKLWWEGKYPADSRGAVGLPLMLEFYPRYWVLTEAELRQGEMACLREALWARWHNLMEDF